MLGTLSSQSTSTTGTCTNDANHHGVPKKPSFKRRKLLSTTTNRPDLPLGGTGISGALQPLPDRKNLESQKTSESGCASCHRARPGYVVLCARCALPTCAICSRTCTASRPRQSTPTMTLASPRRTALSLNTPNTNGTPLQPVPVAGERRKTIEDQDDQEKDIGVKPESEGEREGNEGCGSIICRGCCIEDMQSGSTTCRDCYTASSS